MHVVLLVDLVCHPTRVVVAKQTPNVALDTSIIMDNQTPEEFLDSVEGEISFFRSVMRARPVGIHKHFHVLAIRNAIHNDTGRIIPVEAIWAKLRTCYDLEALETAVRHIGPLPRDTDRRDPTGNRRLRQRKSLPPDDTLPIPLGEPLPPPLFPRRVRAAGGRDVRGARRGAPRARDGVHPLVDARALPTPSEQDAQVESAEAEQEQGGYGGARWRGQR